MRLVSAADAAGVVQSGQRVYLHCAAATPSVSSRRWSIAPRAPRRQRRPPAHRGAGPHLAPEMAGHFRHRALFIGPNARAAVNEGRADYVPVFLSDVPRLFESGACRWTPCSSTLRRPTPRVLFARDSVEAMHAAVRAAKTVIVQFNRSMPRTLGDSFIHVDEIDLGVEVDVPPYATPIRSSATSRSGSARTSLISCPTGDAAARHRRHPGGHAMALRTSATSGSTPRCSRTRSSTWSRLASSPAPPRSATAEDRHVVHDGFAAPLRVRP